MKKLVILISIGSCFGVLVAGRGLVRTNQAVADPDEKALSVAAEELIFCTETAHAVRDAYVEQLSSDGKCLSGALPAPLTSRLCEAVTVYSKPTRKTRRVVEVGVQPQLACLSCADDGQQRSCGQTASVQAKLNLSAEATYLGGKAGEVAFKVDVFAEASYMATDTEIAKVAVTGGQGTTQAFNLVKGVISPVLDYKSGFSLTGNVTAANPVLSAAFKINVSRNCALRSQPESFVLPIGVPPLACPIEMVPEPLPVITTEPPNEP